MPTIYETHMTQTGKATKADRLGTLRRTWIVHHILRLLLKKPRLPLSGGYFFNEVNATDEDILWCLRVLEGYKFVEIECHTMLVATVRTSQNQTHDPVGIEIMRLLDEQSPRRHDRISYILEVPAAIVSEKLNELETLGLVSVKSTPMEFVSLTGGRLHLLLQVLKLAVPRRMKP